MCATLLSLSFSPNPFQIFTGKKLEDISPSTHNMDVPNVFRTEYQLVNIDDGFLNLMTNDGTSKDDVKVPESEIGTEVQAVSTFGPPY